VTETFEVGDLVRDRLNKGQGNYGLGVIVSTEPGPTLGERWDRTDGLDPEPGKKYAVYFNKFEKTITFHGDYLEKV